MTKKEIIDYCEMKSQLEPKNEDVYNYIIKALEQEPCTGSVNRATVLDLINDVQRADGFNDYAHYEYLFDNVNNMPSVTPTQRWIPCSDRLPKIHNRCEKYLVTLEHGGTYVALFTECDGKHWWAYDDVVAWMPLPKQYEK